MLAGAIWSIFSVNLDVKSTERVLVFTDKISARESVAPKDAERRHKLRDLARLAASSARTLAGEVSLVEYPSTGGHGKEPPRKLWEAAFGPVTVAALEEAKLLKPLLAKQLPEARMPEVHAIISVHHSHAVDAVVGLSNFSTSHTAFRSLLTGVCGTRYASMPLFDHEMLSGAMAVDWRALEARTKAVARKVRTAQAVRIKTPDGTDISFSIKKRRVYEDAGNLRRAGAFGNLPAGEVFLAPVEGTAKGRLVLQRAPTRKLSSPVTVTVHDGSVARIDGDEPYVAELAERMILSPLNRNIAELGIGTNDKATRPDNILESEKILGTVHIALGDNHSFGGVVRTPYHQDFVFFKPTVTLIDGEGEKTLLLKGGKLA